MKRRRQYIIVDTCVAKAAGAPKADPQSPAKECLECFDAIDAAELHVLMNHDLNEEWVRHKGPFATKWLSNKIATKRFRAIKDEWAELASFEEAASSLPERKHLELLKDTHIVSMSHMYLTPVLTLEVKLLDLLCTTRPSFPPVNSTEWANPISPDTIDWLHAGVPVNTGHQLVHICRERRDHRVTTE